MLTEESPETRQPNTPEGLGGLLADACQPPRDCFRYETLKFAGRLRILDRDRRVARFTRWQRIRFLEDDVQVFFDRLWGDGVLFAGYSAPSMRILDAFPTRKGYVVTLGLPQAFRKGETFDVVTQRRIVGAFIYDNAYWESAMGAPTELLSIDVFAPRGRTFDHPEIVAPPRGDIHADQHANVLRFRVRQPSVHIPYRLAWAWK
jgi:hypothetical protein